NVSGKGLTGFGGAPCLLVMPGRLRRLRFAGTTRLFPAVRRPKRVTTSDAVILPFTGEMQHHPLPADAPANDQILGAAHGAPHAVDYTRMRAKTYTMSGCSQPGGWFRARQRRARMPVTAEQSST